MTNHIVSIVLERSESLVQTDTDTQPQLVQDEVDNIDSEILKLQPIERKVYGNVDGRRIEHALGARVSHLIEQEIISDAYEFRENRRRQKERHNAGTEDGDGHASRGWSRSIPRNYFREARQQLIDDSIVEDRQKLLQHQGSPLKRDLDMWDLPPFLRRQYVDYRATVLNDQNAKPSRTLSVTDWLAKDTPEATERLVNYLQYNTHTHEQDQEYPALKNAIARVKKEWHQGVEIGLDQGWLDPSAGRVAITAEHVTVVFGDFYDLAAQHRGGYAVNGKRYVVLEPSLSTIGSVGKHEFNHTLLGHFEHKWLDEAMTEHLAQVFNKNREIDDIKSNGVFEDTRSRRPYTSDTVYRGPRYLLAELIGLTDGQLTIEDFSRAYSSNDRSNPDYTAQDELGDKLDEIFGATRVLDRMNTDIESMITKFQEASVFTFSDALDMACQEVQFAMREQGKNYFTRKDA